ncbi:DUF2267 domain-containing protein [Halalkalicoccus salilacus]|uniref:DUF2267 domain-containing protein n=1 Tax=Halalkalicoccus salilacus TaxID=3117459 RepID=UPI00300F105F
MVRVHRDDTRTDRSRSNGEAETVAVATLQALGTRITEGQPEDVAEQLLDELAGVFSMETKQATDLTAQEFLERVENEEQDAGIEGDAEEHVGAVLSTFEETIDTSEWQSVRSQLPDEYDGPLR